MRWTIQAQITVDSFLVLHFPDSSNRTRLSWLRQGRLLLKGQPVRRAKQILQVGDELQFLPRTFRAPDEHSRAGLIPVLYQDQHLIIVDKPAGMLSVAASYDPQRCVQVCLEQRLKRPVHAVHRLDRETSGALCFARTEESAEALKELFAAHAIQRRYFAVVCGQPPARQGTWSSWLWEHPESYKVHDLGNHSLSPKADAALAITHYTLQSVITTDRSLLELNLETGKKHQIRVHCAAAGCPVLGDLRYGGAKSREMHLHAAMLGFEHPITKQMIHCTSVQPAWLKRAIMKSRLTR